MEKEKIHKGVGGIIVPLGGWRRKVDDFLVISRYLSKAITERRLKKEREQEPEVSRWGKLERVGGQPLGGGKRKKGTRMSRGDVTFWGRREKQERLGKKSIGKRRKNWSYKETGRRGRRGIHLVGGVSGGSAKKKIPGEGKG